MHLCLGVRYWRWGVSIMHYFIMRIPIDVSKPPPLSMRFGAQVQLEICGLLCYDKLPMICYFCCRIRFIQRDCTTSIGELVLDNISYGWWLKSNKDHASLLWNFSKKFDSPYWPREARSIKGNATHVDFVRSIRIN